MPSRFPSNRVTSSKYTALSFLPKNLFEQFRRVANFYFLCVAVIQLIPNVAPVTPLTSILPLVFVVSVTAVKQAYEDYQRHLADNEVNHKPAVIVRDGAFVNVLYEEIEVRVVWPPPPAPLCLGLLLTSILFGALVVPGSHCSRSSLVLAPRSVTLCAWRTSKTFLAIWCCFRRRVTVCSSRRPTSTVRVT